MPPKVIGEKLKGRYQNSMHAPRRASELNSIDVISEGRDYSRYTKAMTLLEKAAKSYGLIADGQQKAGPGI